MNKELILSILFFGACNRVRSLSQIYVKDGHFVDEHQRVVLLRGINSVIKHFPWYDPRLLDPERQQQLGDWGFNNVRLGAMWSGVEPVEGQINETYIGILKDTVAGLGDQGVYSYLDMHQDVLKQSAGYAGIPEWLADRLQPPNHPYPWPMNTTSGFSTWACGYFTEDISNSFQQLYTEHKEEFAWVWKQIAERFKDDNAVLGYELMNEPWTGDLYQDASLILPGNAGYELLEPFYTAAHEAIREVDDESLIFWEPVTYAYFLNAAPNILLDGVLDAFLKSQNFTVFLPILKLVCGDMAEDTDAYFDVGDALNSLISLSGEASSHMFNHIDLKSSRPSTLGPGFTNPPGGPDYLNRTVLSWHYYCWAIGYGESDGDYDPQVRALCDDYLGPMVFDTVIARAKELGGSASMLTEFGICVPKYDQPDSEGTIECNFVLDQADSHFQSWSYWDTASGYALWDSEGLPDLNIVKVFSRPYPQATAGNPVRLHYDFTTRTLEYVYKPNLSIRAPTVLFVSPLIYEEGYEVEASENLSWEVDPDNQGRILVEASTDEESMVKITPRN